MKFQHLFVAAITAGCLAACAGVPRTADNVTLARIAKDAIGVASIDEMEISNVQTLPTESHMNDTHYRYFVDTARKKKFVCDVVLRGIDPMTGKSIAQDTVKCDQR